MNGRRRKSSRRAGNASERGALKSMLSRLKAGLDVRKQKVRRVRSKLREQTYVNLLKLDVAAQRLADDLMD